VRKKIQICNFIVLGIALAVMLMALREYRRSRDASRLLYTQTIKASDILDAARNAISALADAEVRADSYVATGVTVYSEAYADDIRVWQDESGALALVAAKGVAGSFIQEFSQAGNRTVDELNVIMALREKQGREAALERSAKASAVAYLDKARMIANAIQMNSGGSAITLNRTFIDRTVAAIDRLTLTAVLLFFVTLASVILSFFLARHVGDSAASSRSPDARTFTAAR
jgi:CHASE3 domain sensor protein